VDAQIPGDSSNDDAPVQTRSWRAQPTARNWGTEVSGGASVEQLPEPMDLAYSDGRSRFDGVASNSGEDDHFEGVGTASTAQTSIDEVDDFELQLQALQAEMTPVSRVGGTDHFEGFETAPTTGLQNDEADDFEAQLQMLLAENESSARAGVEL